MAANKRKIQANAQKYLQKGQLDKALKEYQGLVQLDPRDSNSRLKMGDIYLRQGDKDKASEAYIKVAEQFMKDGFDAKAVAIYKQVGKIDPERLDIYEPLAELYQRLGLTSEALVALQTAADAYNKEGRKRDALELLRKMATLDPTNTTSRLKIADLLRQAEMDDDALAEFVAVAEELERQGARDELVSVYDRILEVDPERTVTLTSLTRILVEQGPPERAQPYAERLVAASPDTPEGHEFLATIHTSLGREDAAQGCYRTLAEMYRRTGDEDRAQEISQRIFGSELAGTSDGGLGGDFTDLPSEPGAAAPDEDLMEQTLDLSGADGAFSADAETLLAEASVYLRYGKAERAIATLDALLSTEPDHRPALEKLGEAHSEHGDPAKAVTVWVRAAEIARVEEDADGFAVLCERIAGLDAAAAEALGGDSGGTPAAAAPAPPLDPVEIDDEPALESDDVEVQIELGDESLGDDPALEEDDGDDEIDLDLDGDLDLDAAEDEPAEEPGAAEQTVLQGAPDATVMQPQAGADATMMQLDEDEDEEAAQTGSGSETTPQQIAEHLEEAGFYFEQNLFDEAEALYNKVLEAAPQHPQAMVRLGEIAAKRGEDPAVAGAEVEAAAPAPASDEAPAPAEDNVDAPGDELAGWDDDVEIETGSAAGEHDDDDVDLDIDVDLDGEPAFEAEAESDEDADTAVTAEPAASAAAAATDPELEQEAAESVDEVEIEFDVDLDDAEDDEEDTATSLEAATAEAEPNADVDAAAEEPQVEEPDPLEEVEEPAAPEEPEAPEEAEKPVAAQAAAETEETLEEPAADEEEEDSDDASFDLAAELSDVFDGDETAATGSPGDTDDGFNAIFREFKKGVKEQLSDSDFEAHYDLGIAYREMGLLDDAVVEFGTAFGSAELKLSSLHMLGLCALDQQQPQDAASHFEKALALPSIPDEQKAALRYDWGRALHASGDVARARAAFQAVANVDPDYQDVSELLAALDSGDVGKLEPDVETFESFDDLIAEAESVLDDDDDEGDTDDAGEDEAEAIAEPDEPLLEAVVEPEQAETLVEAEVTLPAAEPLEFEPEPEREPEPKPKKRRRKKISF